MIGFEVAAQIENKVVIAAPPESCQPLCSDSVTKRNGLRHTHRRECYIPMHPNHIEGKAGGRCRIGRRTASPAFQLVPRTFAGSTAATLSNKMTDSKSGNATRVIFGVATIAKSNTRCIGTVYEESRIELRH
jgi:hypothetical protein